MNLKKENGITLMSLVITIIVMVILIGIIGYYAIDSVRNSYISNEKKEMAAVLNYTTYLRTKLLADEYTLSNDTVATEEMLLLLKDSLPEEQINRMIEVNTYDELSADYKYHYISFEKLSDKNFSDGNVTVKDAKYNYIINFYTGTIIGLYDSRSEISGMVKGLSDILLELNS